MDPEYLNLISDRLADLLRQKKVAGQIARLDDDVVRAAVTGFALAYQDLTGDRMSPNELMHLQEALLRKAIARAA